LKDSYLAKHGYHKQEIHSIKDLHEGDVIMLKTPPNSDHIDPIMHVGIVMRNPKTGELYVIQKPDPVLKIQKCSMQNFADHFSKEYTKVGTKLDIPGPYVEIYRGAGH
jgi:hypothetical protein